MEVTKWANSSEAMFSAGRPSDPAGSLANLPGDGWPAGEGAGDRGSVGSGCDGGEVMIGLKRWEHREDGDSLGIGEDFQSVIVTGIQERFTAARHPLNTVMPGRGDARSAIRTRCAL